MNGQFPAVAGPLRGTRVAVRGAGASAEHARALTAVLGGDVARPGETAAIVVDLDAAPDPAQDWADSGAEELTGRADGPALTVSGTPASAIRAGLALFAELSRIPGRLPPHLPGPGLLSERAASTGWSRNGPASVGGAFRLLPTADSHWIGVSLARESDRALIPALVERVLPAHADPWQAVAAWVAATPADTAGERARLLGLPSAVPPRPGTRDAQMLHRSPEGFPQPVLATPLGVALTRPRRPLVVDMSALWAGPLCAHLLGLAGMRVVKVESTTRPDGMRRGNRYFYDLLHAGHESVALDFRSPRGREALRALISAADVVIEASRPRALAQLGIDPREVAARRGGLTWVSITAYGRTGPWANLPGFGDDVAAAAGLLAWEDGAPLPCADAIADPLTGVVAAAAAAASIRSGGGYLLDVAMRDACLAAAVVPAPASAGRPVPYRPTLPTPRRVAGAAVPMGADTGRVLGALAALGGPPAEGTPLWD